MLTREKLLEAKIGVEHDTEEQPNALFQKLDKKILQGLYDLLFWNSTQGPYFRIRDMLCHGQVYPHIITKKFADYVWSICINLCLKYHFKNIGNVRMSVLISINIRRCSENTSDIKMDRLYR